MQIIKSILYDSWQMIFILVLAFFLFKSCNKPVAEPQILTVTIPEVIGKFEPQVPLHIPLSTEPKKTSTEPLAQNPINKKLIAENEKLKQDFALANDSIKKLLFEKSVQLNSFSSNFEDENVIIDINGIVQGEVKEVSPNYKIKEKKIDVPVKVKETALRVLLGGEIGNNTKLDGFTAKANLMLQNRKGNILSTSFDTNQTIWVGYHFSILNIKR